MAPTWRHVCYWPLADTPPLAYECSLWRQSGPLLAKRTFAGKKGRTEQLKARWVADAVPHRLPNAFVRSNVSSVPFVASFLPASAPSPAWVEKEAQGLCF
jgi:hypothetical protein